MRPSPGTPTESRPATIGLLLLLLLIPLLGQARGSAVRAGAREVDPWQAPAPERETPLPPRFDQQLAGFRVRAGQPYSLQLHSLLPSAVRLQLASRQLHLVLAESDLTTSPLGAGSMNDADFDVDLPELAPAWIQLRQPGADARSDRSYALNSSTIADEQSQSTENDINTQPSTGPDAVPGVDVDATTADVDDGSEFVLEGLADSAALGTHYMVIWAARMHGNGGCSVNMDSAGASSAGSVPGAGQGVSFVRVFTVDVVRADRDRDREPAMTSSADADPESKRLPPPLCKARLGLIFARPVLALADRTALHRAVARRFPKAVVSLLTSYPLDDGECERMWVGVGGSGSGMCIDEFFPFLFRASRVCC